MWYLKVCYSLSVSVCISECKARGREWGQIPKQARKVSRILRPFVVIYDRESDRMHTLASPLRGSSSHPFTPRCRDRDSLIDTPKEKVLCTICCPTIFQPLQKIQNEHFSFLLVTMLMSANCALQFFLPLSFVVVAKAKMHTMIIHFCLPFLQCKKSSNDLSGGFRA